MLMRSVSFVRRQIAPAALALFFGACAMPASSPSEATVAAHVAAATAAAGVDLTPLLSLCKPAPATRPSQAETEHGLAGLMAQPAPPPGRAFDNLYFVGSRWVSAWALKTSEGIILIDALNNRDEAATLIESGLRLVGLNPSDIRIVIVTHGHGDHYGGVDYLVERYHPRVVMSGLDWTMTETRLEFDAPIWGRPPRRDVSVADADRVTLGDTTVMLYLTPGHTAGTLSPVFDVRSGGERHRAMLWGGTGFNFGNDRIRLNAYVQSTERMQTIARQEQIDVMISNHPGYDGSIGKLDRLRDAPAGTNPFVLGTGTVVRSLTVMNECARATRDRFALAP